jgi:hypothetical protein
MSEREMQDVRLQLGESGKFVMKTGVVSVAVVLSLWVVLDILDGFMSRRMQEMNGMARAIGGRQFWTGLEEQLDKLADPQTDLSPEKKRHILSQIKAISDRWRPFLTEASAIIEGKGTQANSDPNDPRVVQSRTSTVP